jgi:hypothetical protein
LHRQIEQRGAFGGHHVDVPLVCRCGEVLCISQRRVDKEFRKQIQQLFVFQKLYEPIGYMRKVSSTTEDAWAGANVCGELWHSLPHSSLLPITRKVKEALQSSCLPQDCLGFLVVVDFVLMGSVTGTLLHRVSKHTRRDGTTVERRYTV